jgi:hypothetical protein
LQAKRLIKRLRALQKAAEGGKNQRDRVIVHSRCAEAVHGAFGICASLLVRQSLF